MSTRASKDYNTEDAYSSTDFKEGLYWPDVNNMHDMLKINIVEYLPIAKSTVGGTNQFTNISNIQSQTQVFEIGTNANKRNKKTLSTVMLPVPNDINYADQLQWGSEALGILGKMAPALAKGALTDASGMGDKLSKLAGAGTPEFLLNQIGKTSVFSPQAVQALTQGIGGVILNPYEEQIFKGIGMREFTFSWKLVPRSSSEQSKIHKIIKALRYYSLPNYSARVGINDGVDQNIETNRLQDRWLTVPNIFELNWVQAGTDNTIIQSLPKIKPCVLKAISVNYTPDNVWATHLANGPGLSGPAPVAYDININFAETEIITSSDVLSTGGGY
jgi:hypothetical protein